MLGRGALCRLTADAPKTRHELPLLARYLQRTLFARNASSSPAVRAFSRAYTAALLESRRSYATTTSATKPTATVKKAVKATAAKKAAPKAKAAPAKPRKTPAATKAKTKTSRAKKAASKKAAPKKAARRKRVKKEATPEQKEKAKISELRKKALKEPVSYRPLSGRNAFVAEQIKRGGNGASAQLKDVSVKWMALSPAEHEHYNHIARERSAARLAEYQAWIRSHTPLQIKVANNARLQLRKKLKGTTKRAPAYTHRLVDDRQIKQARSTYAYFFAERMSSGDFKGIQVKDSSKLVGEEWKALSAGEKKKYEDEHAADQTRYKREKAAQS